MYWRMYRMSFRRRSGTEVKTPRAMTSRSHGDTIDVTGAPPFEPDTGEICVGPIERQTELVLEQLKLCVETAGSSLEKTS